jgi:hypothetical protein
MVRIAIAATVRITTEDISNASLRGDTISLDLAQTSPSPCNGNPSLAHMSFGLTVRGIGQRQNGCKWAMSGLGSTGHHISGNVGAYKVVLCATADPDGKLRKPRELHSSANYRRIDLTMSTTSTTITERPGVTTLSASRRLILDGTDPTFGDWRDDLIRDGYAVIKGAIPRERAEKYVDAMYSWLEGL